MSSAHSGPLSIGLDLGTTRIKAGLLSGEHTLSRVESARAPELQGSNWTRESDPRHYVDAVDDVIRRVTRDLDPGLPLGLASQRSSFVLWHPETGELATPLISWQDRRGEDWCRRHQHLATRFTELTGLVLSAHYAGPKLASLIATKPDLLEALSHGDLVFGTLDTYLLWHWSQGHLHRTDSTMAARTLMLDLGTLQWSPELLGYFGIPETALPQITGNTAIHASIPFGPEVTATLTDQAAGALALLRPGDDSVAITLGTGGFVLAPQRGSIHRDGYLQAPILVGLDADSRQVWEGTVNGAGAALDRFPTGPAELKALDPSPDAFCLPDVAGLGSPFWRPDVGLTLSPSARGLDPAGQRRVVLEGVLFRLRQILDDLFPAGLPQRILLSGGVTREPALCTACASILDSRVERVLQSDSGLIGVARLAAGRSPFANPPTEATDPPLPGEPGAYLRDKYARWHSWFHGVLSSPPTS